MVGAIVGLSRTELAVVMEYLTSEVQGDRK
jgi:hypothetical protein